MRWLLFCFTLPVFLEALPYSPQVAEGSATCSVLNPQTLEVLAADRSIIDWKRFNIDCQETVRFIQPDDQSVVINRVSDPFPSDLLGNLKANGKVFLVNPNGIHFGENASIQTGSFIASTLDIRARLREGEFAFSGSKGKIIQKGKIATSSGNLFLISPEIEVSGSLQSNRGLIGCFAVNELESLNSLEGCCSNTKLTIQGQIDLQKGGAIYLTGSQVAIEDFSTITARGSDVFIGGGFQGEVPPLPKAERLFLASQACIDTSSPIDGGDAGQIVLWSKDATRFLRHLLSQGGRGEWKWRKSRSLRTPFPRF